MSQLLRPETARPDLARRRFVGWAASALVLASGPLLARADDPLARDLLVRADRVRFPEEPFQVDVVITTYGPGAEPEERAYRILSRGNTRTLVQTTAPAIERGQILLMRDRELWAFLPNLSQPIRLPLAQRLSGQVANGDLARANFAGDYVPSVLRQETVEDEAYTVLRLDAVDRWVTYRSVNFWVNTRTARPYKAEFHAVSGRLMKTATYQDFEELGGRIRPTRMVVEDALRPGYRSELEYSDMTPRELPDRLFTKDYLKRLSR
jgi:outer membrane lipoprotein-sorting protein